MESSSLASIPVSSSIGHHLLFLHLLYFRTLLFLDCSFLVPRATQGPLLPVECQSLVSMICAKIIPFICQPPANKSMNLFWPEAVQWLRRQMWESRLHRTGLKRSWEAAQRPHCLTPDPPLPCVTSSVTSGSPHIPRSPFPLWSRLLPRFIFQIRKSIRRVLYKCLSDKVQGPFVLAGWPRMLSQPICISSFFKSQKNITYFLLLELNKKCMQFA